MKDSPHLVLGFEDLLGSGDRDFNDILFAVDIGAVDVAALTATSEPATMPLLRGDFGRSSHISALRYVAAADLVGLNTAAPPRFRARLLLTRHTEDTH